MRPISPIRHERPGGERKRERERERKIGSTYILARENASLIKSILGNRRCMNDGELVRGVPPSEKIRAYRRREEWGGYNGAIRRGSCPVFHREAIRRYIVRSRSRDYARKHRASSTVTHRRCFFCRKRGKVTAICAAGTILLLLKYLETQVLQFSSSVCIFRACACARARVERQRMQDGRVGQSARDR